MNLSQSVFSSLPNIKDLPLILAGPVLRRTEPEQVTVWLALKESRALGLTIHETTDNGQTIGKILLQGQRNTISLGRYLHIVAITAKSARNTLLQPGKIYAYNVFDAGEDEGAIDDFATNPYSLSYFPHGLPTFSLPPDNLNQLKIVHGSCRKPHGGGRDTLSCLDNLIGASASLASERPHQLFLTGAQIYGDDVANPLLWLAQGINQLLLGWSEELPLISGTMTATELIPGQRATIADREGGLTAMFKGSPEKAKSHLFSFGEYAAIYLLAWSPVLMPESFPSGESLFEDRQKARLWEQELYEINSFVKDLSRVRRALANVPVYTICDDHEISDDWYLNREWCERVLGKPLGQRIVQNGLLAYALFQSWGNTPENFAAGTTGEKLLQLASRWLASAGQDLLTKAEIARYLGIPSLDNSTGLPKYERDRDVLILSRDEGTIPWYYTISGSRHQVIVLDTRTWRGYPSGEDQKLEPPMLLSPKAFEQQLHIPLQQNQLEATIVVLPTNLVALGIIARLQQFELSRERVFRSDVGDAWNLNQKASAKLLLSLCQQRQRIIILSGDIHYSCGVKITHWGHNSLKASVIAQLTSSAIKNSALATRLLQTKLKSLLPEKTEHWLGWEEPLQVKKISKFPRQNLPLPDWQYRIEWCKRQPAQPLPWQQSRRKNPGQTNLWLKFIAILIAWLWRNPWLQEGSEVVGRNNLSLVKFKWSTTKAVIQETYWHPPWNNTGTVKSNYEVSLEPAPLPSLPKIKMKGNRDLS